MKFMQRAAASATSNGSPESDTHSAKKRKLGHGSPAGRVDVNIDQAAIQAALDDREAKRQAALDKHVGGDTRWVLKDTWTDQKASGAAKSSMNVVYVGYGDMGSSDDSSDWEESAANGRTTTAKFKKGPKEASLTNIPNYNRT